MLDQIQELRRNERLRGQARVNPWNDVWELESVGEMLLRSVELLSDERIRDTKHASSSIIIMRLEDALQQVNVWKSRTNALPHAIESTAAFAQIILRDFQGNVSSSELRLAYSSAILRSINGLADVMQQQRVHAASVTMLCQQLGIPSWLVGIRHEATHNQLPSLAVLRLSSKSLLQYFRQVYWDPLARAKLDHLNDANALLQNYHKAALQIVMANEEQDEVPDNTSEPLSSEPANRKQNGKADDETQATILLPFQSKLGTSFNSFAVLQSTSSKKTKEKRKRPRRKAAASKKQKSQQGDNKIIHISSSGKTACPSLGQAFVRANVPLDISRYALLSYLIWKGPEIEGMSVGGVLFTVEMHEDRILEDIFELLKQRYLPLIQATCRAWPGFLTTVLVHIVDAVLSMEEIEKDSSSEEVLAKISLLEHWVCCLLSKDSLLQMFPTLGPALKRYKPDVAIQNTSLLSLQLPLNSLCDRCEEEGSSDPSSSSNALAGLFIEMLGNDRVKHFGASLTQDKNIAMVNAIEQDETVCRNEENPTVPDVLSLDEMEKLLGEKSETARIDRQVENVVDRNVAVEDESAAKNETNHEQAGEPRKSWMRCTNWDACAIGSLPGHPN